MALELISSSIRTKKDLYFSRQFLPAFTFESVEDGSYLSTISQCQKAFTNHMSEWNIFAPRVEGPDVLRATLLSHTKADFANKQLPLGENTRHTVVLYSGGGGFLANLQMIQENFLTKTIFK